MASSHRDLAEGGQVRIRRQEWYRSDRRMRNGELSSVEAACYCCNLHLAGNKVSIAYAVPERADVEGLQAIIDRQQLPFREE